ncbi:putative ATP-dependent RNA helicase DDX49 [Gracilariopsis chorda]|uniref:Putative ATP-dependent RNA helicase DDX49 n=1 Tax=Gracilariopsis chorda TaxID=448386 RepID=A0A2V3J764_9FLOR|nr:putative ATP-dependent RNA helicase DDX49 [Gracilariopsis chorda]|eukprot:PXF49807.1 putative ATP-dependent RNA helicase DDX49 [Gracilariopsis chorda]
MTNFRALGVKPWLIESCKTLGIKKPTPVQLACISPILQGRNVIGAAETGTGKTAAFVLPILQKLAEDPYGVFAVILTPTRELAFQIAQQINAFGARIAVKHHVLVGGIHELSQAAALAKKPHILVATPGRMALMVSKGYVKLDKTRFLVLDEADRLLDPTYLTDLMLILNACSSPKRQTLMFSATMTSSLEQLQQVAMNDDQTFRFDARKNRFATVDALRQEYLFLPQNLKECHLVNLLKEEYPTSSVIIFVARCDTAELLLNMLNLLGMNKVAALHSDMKQVHRIESLQRFKGKLVRALIATDVASRGLDIPTCELVINYDLPAKVATYVHRVGRTARAGRSGLALSFVAQQDVEIVKAIEEKIEKALDKHEGNPERKAMENLALTLKARQMAKLRLQDSGYFDKSEARRKSTIAAAKRRKQEQRNLDGRKKQRIST